MSIEYLFHDGLFYIKEVHGDKIPKEAKIVTEDEYREALQKRSEGFDVVPGLHGEPTYIKAQIKPFEPSEIRISLLYEMGRRLDDLAKSWGYLSCVDVVSYYNSASTESKTLAKSMIKYRDTARAYIIKSSEEYKPKNGQSLSDSVSAIMAVFPKYQ